MLIVMYVATEVMVSSAFPIVQRWYINGNVKCFSGGHIPLGLLAIVVLGFCLSIIPITLIYSVGWLQVGSLTPLYYAVLY